RCRPGAPPGSTAGTPRRSACSTRSRSRSWPWSRAACAAGRSRSAAQALPPHLDTHLLRLLGGGWHPRPLQRARRSVAHELGEAPGPDTGEPGALELVPALDVRRPEPVPEVRPLEEHG